MVKVNILSMPSRHTAGYGETATGQTEGEVCVLDCVHVCTLGAQQQSVCWEEIDMENIDST